MSDPLFVHTIDGTTLRVEPYDGIGQLRVSIAPIGKPSAGVNVALETAADMARAVLVAAGYRFPDAPHVEAPAGVDHAADSARRVHEFGRRAQADFNQRKREVRR